MSALHRARHRASGNIVAIKLPTPGNPRTAESLRREIDVLSRIDHPGVIRLLDHGSNESGPWYAMPLLERGRLVVGRGPVDATATATADGWVDDGAEAFESPPPSSPSAVPVDHDAIGVLRRLCGTLEWLHGAGIVHRDLKPENILLDHAAAPVLIDFGVLARVAGVTGRDELAFDPGAAGSPSYMAPEQLRGEDVDARTDLYALGCMLYEALTGTPPFAAAGMGPLRATILSVEPEPPSVRNPLAPPSFDRLVLDLLAKFPEQRPGFAADVGHALEALGAGPLDRTLPLARPYLYRPSFIGRTELLEQARELLEASLVGRDGGLVFAVGPSGAGKTRLVQEIVRRARRQRRTVVLSRCGDVGLDRDGTRASGRPLEAFLPLLQRVGASCRAEGSDALLCGHGPVLEQYQPSLATVPGRSQQPDASDVPPEVAAERAQAATAKVLDAYATAARPLLVIDDIQWGDELSLGVLRHLAFNPHVARSCSILVTMRSEEQIPGFEQLAARPRVLVWSLDPFGPDDVRSMVRGMTAAHDPPAPVIDLLVRESSGNPMFVSAFLRQAVAEDRLRRDVHGWSVQGEDWQGIARPPSLDELLRARLEALPPDCEALVAVGSVLGRRFDLPTALQLADLDRPRGMAAVARLEAHWVMDLDPDAASVRFSHDTVLETAYARLDDALRTALHRDAGTLLERDEATPHELLARHFRLGGVDQRALDHYLEGARVAVGDGRHRLAAQLVAQARELRGDDGVPRLDRLPLERRCTALRTEGQALVAGGRPHEVEAVATTGLRLLDQPVPTGGAGWAWQLCRALAGRLASRWRGEAPGSTATRPTAYFHYLHWYHYFYANDPFRSTVALLRSVNLAERLGDWETGIRSGAYWGMMLGMMGRRQAAERWFERCEDWATRSPIAGVNLQYFIVRCNYHLLRAEWERTEQLVCATQRACRETGSWHDLAWSSFLRALNARLSGQLDRARAVVDHSIHLGREREYDDILRSSLILRAGIRLQSGDLEGAQADAEECSERATRAAAVVHEVNSWTIAAVVASRTERFDRALDLLEQARQRLEGSSVATFALWEYHRYGPEVLCNVLSARVEPAAGELRSRLDATLRSASKFARMQRSIRPAALRNEARAAHLQGHARRALRRIEASIAAAQRLRMPFEHAESQRILASLPHAPADRRRMALASAHATMTTLGCRWHLAQLDQMKEPP